MAFHVQLLQTIRALDANEDIINKILGRYLPGVSSEGAQCISPRARSRFRTLLVPGRIVVEVLWLLFVSVPSLPAGLQMPNVMPRIWFGCCGCLDIYRDSM